MVREKKTFILYLNMTLVASHSGVTHIFFAFSLLCYAQVYKLALAAFTVASHRHIQVGMCGVNEKHSQESFEQSTIPNMCLIYECLPSVVFDINTPM